jgi:hypothetical protein
VKSGVRNRKRTEEIKECQEEEVKNGAMFSEQKWSQDRQSHLEPHNFMGIDRRRFDSHSLSFFRKTLTLETKNREDCKMAQLFPNLYVCTFHIESHKLTFSFFEVKKSLIHIKNR